MVVRLPEFSASPIAMFFPIGNSNSGEMLLTDGFDSEDEKSDDPEMKERKGRHKLTMTNGINNPAIVTIDGLSYDDIHYYECKYRKRFPELNWSSESESDQKIIRISVLPRKNWPKSDITKYHESDPKRRVKLLIDDNDVKERELASEIIEEIARERKVVEPDSPELVENPLTRSIHVDPSLAAKFLSALTRK